MRKAVVPILLLMLLSSCAVYTVGEGKEGIRLPEKVSVPETRYSIIRDEGLDITKYLSNPTLDEFPYYFDFSESNMESDGKGTLSAVFFHIDGKSDNEKESMISSLGNLDPDFIIISGSPDDAYDIARMTGRNALVTEKGAVLSLYPMVENDDDEGLYAINDEKRISVGVYDIPSELPESGSEYLSYLENKESGNVHTSSIGESALYALSSDEPGYDDWSLFTPYKYRIDRSFPIARIYIRRGWQDAWRETHYDGDTDPGATRTSGEVAERLEQLYFKNLIPSKSTLITLAGNEGKAVYFEFLMP